MNHAWRKRALCLIDKNSRHWFSYKYSEVEYAKAVCQSCTVRKECLVNMWETDSFYGVNGGLSEFDIMEITWRKVKKADDPSWKRTDKTFQDLLRKVS